jgi:molybdenum cofactor cytidylyltransferase
MKIHAVLLAAGRSRRLGRAKQLVHLGGETLLARAARGLEVSGVSSLRIVLGDPDEAIDAEATRTRARILRSVDPAEGSAASIRTAVEDLQANEPEPHGVLFAVTDQLAADSEHVSALVRTFLASADGKIAGTPRVPA